MRARVGGEGGGGGGCSGGNEGVPFGVDDLMNVTAAVARLAAMAVAVSEGGGQCEGSECEGREFYV